jgi:HEAT repeat protein
MVEQPQHPAPGASAGGSAAPHPGIPPFEEPTGARGGVRAIAQLFLIPAGIVAVAVGVFLVMNFLVGGERSPEDILQSVAGGDSRRRGQAAFELSKRIVAEPAILRDAEFLQRLVGIYARSEGNVELRRYLTVCLSQVEDLGSVPQAVTELVKASGDADAQTRLYAVVALGNARAAAALPRLQELTADSDKGIRLAAVAGVANLADPASLPVLQARLTDPASEVAWHAAIALAQMGDSTGEAVLRRLLEPGFLGGQPGVVPAAAQELMRMAASALGRLETLAPSPERRALLEEVGRSAPYPVVQEAARAALRDPAPGAS